MVIKVGGYIVSGQRVKHIDFGVSRSKVLDPDLDPNFVLPMTLLFIKIQGCAIPLWKAGIKSYNCYYRHGRVHCADEDIMT